MKEAIKLIEQEIERQTIFLKAETDPDFVVDIAKKIEGLKRAVKKLNIQDGSKSFTEKQMHDAYNKGYEDGSSTENEMH